MHTEMNSLPPLQISSSGPIVLGAKQSKTRRSSMQADFYVSEQEISSCDEIPTATGNGIPHRRGNTKYIMDITEQSRQKKVCRLNDGNNDARQRLDKTDSYTPHSKCTLRRVGTCFVMVKESRSLENNPTGSVTTLPGEVESDEVDICTPRPGQAMMHINKFWNFSHQMEDLERTEKFTKYARHCLLQIRKFINKLQLAITEEELYIHKVKSAISTDKSMEFFSAGADVSPTDARSGQYNFPSIEVQPQPSRLMPPKQGKVYAEFQNHFKVWDDLLHRWDDLRMDLYHASNLLPTLQKKISRYQMEMLHLTYKLITVRLRSLASCAVISTEPQTSEYDWSALLGAGCLKRFCKLVEVYNSAFRKYCQRHCFQECLGAKRAPSSVLLDEITSYGDTKLAGGGRLREFTASRILSELSIPAKHALGVCMLHILSSINAASYHSMRSKRCSSPHDGRIDWGMVDDVEVDEDDVITQIMGHDVIHISDTNLSDETLSTVKHLMYGQGSFIVAFMNCLASNTSLMRNKLRSKSPRSISSSQHFPDEASAISSEDDISSIASSSFFSQLSGTGPTTSHHKRKTVLWRDSWDQEAVKSLSKMYMAMLVTEGPVSSLQLQLDEFVNEEPNGQYAIRLKPRFGCDFGVIMLDAFVGNMISLELLPRDVLRSVQSSTQAFVIDRALIQWDRKFCQALAISGTDKCGALPIRGTHPLTKTALTYQQAVQTLLAVMKFHDREDVTQKALPRLESTLDSFYAWCYGKIQQFLANWSLRPLLQVFLSDLGQLTSIGLTCSPMVEKCHNFVESRRIESPATLHHATRHLQNIENIITNMQSLTGECMRMYTEKCKHLASRSISSTFPPHKMWRQKTLTDHSCPSQYMEESVRAVLVPVCSAVSVLNYQCQLTAVPPAVSALLEVTIEHIIERKVRFSVQGALQLQRDFEFVAEFVCSTEAKLCGGVTRAVPNLAAVKKAARAAAILQRTDGFGESGGKGGYAVNRARGRRTSRVSAFNADDPDHHNQDESSLLEKQLLALRFQGKAAKRWFGLPCADKAAD